MKKFSATLAAAALFLAANALADVGVVNVGATNKIGLSATTSANLGGAVNVGKSSSVGVYMAFAGSDAGTGQVLYTWVRSYDGVTYETSPGFKTSAAFNGLTPVVVYTNIASSSLEGVKFIKLSSIANADAINGTNASVKVAIKTIKPSP